LIEAGLAVRRPHARCVDVALHRHFLRRGVSLRQGVPEVEVAMQMDWISATGLILSILLMVYLTVALLFPEKF
jgi:K+-transporting ATPase KdpF subunit